MNKVQSAILDIHNGIQCVEYSHINTYIHTYRKRQKFHSCDTEIEINEKKDELNGERQSLKGRKRERSNNNNNASVTHSITHTRTYTHQHPYTRTPAMVK